MLKFSLFLIGLVAASKLDYCPENIDELAINCNLVAATFIYQTKNFGTEQGVSIDTYNRTCETLQACTSILSCGAKSPEKVAVARQMGYECQIFAFLKGHFNACYGQLLENNSECFNSFDPLREFAVEKVDEEGECENFFGPDNCLREEIVETCGLDEWIKFEKAYDEINPLRVYCKLRAD